MNGLLIKDLQLLKSQKNFFIMMFIITIGMVGLSYDSYFAISFITFVMTLFTLSTISYDEFDNGYPFLMTLPFSRKNYVLEKYLFGILLGICGWMYAFTVITGFQLLNGQLISIDDIIPSILIIPSMLIVLAIMLPFHFKYGGEKGRIMIIAVVACVILLAVTVFKIASNFNINLMVLFDQLLSADAKIIIMVIILLVAIFFGISYGISNRIVSHKEY